MDPKFNNSHNIQIIQDACYKSQVVRMEKIHFGRISFMAYYLKLSIVEKP